MTKAELTRPRSLSPAPEPVQPRTSFRPLPEFLCPSVIIPSTGQLQQRFLHYLASGDSHGQESSFRSGNCQKSKLLNPIKRSGPI